MSKEATQYKKGEGGRPKGIKNKITRTVKETVLDVFNHLQHDEEAKLKRANLKEWAKDHPRDFYQIAAKLIPTEVQGSFEVNGIKQIFEINGKRIEL